MPGEGSGECPEGDRDAWWTDLRSGERYAVLGSVYQRLVSQFIFESVFQPSFIIETLRLYPAVPVLERKSSQNYKIPDTDVTIPKGTKIHIPVFAIHRDPQLYPEPLKFNPDRFLPEEAAKRHPNSFLTFGDGPRACIGFRFAILQSKVGLATMLSKFRISTSAKTAVPLEYTHKSPFLQPKKELVLKIESL